MRLRGLLIVVFFILALWPASAVHAEERWSKDIEGHTIWTAKNQPYIVTNTIKIKEGTTLVIDPGVSVRLLPDVSLEVYGQLRAIARENGPISFTWANPGQRWGSIKVQSGGNANLNMVTVRHAKVGLSTFGWGSGTAVYTSVFRDNEIAMHNAMRGGDGNSSYSLTVQRTLITRNTTGVIFTEGTTWLYRNNISENIEQGIGAFSKGRIEDNTIYANGTDGIETVTRGGNAELQIRRNTINYNGLGGLSLRYSTFLIEHNNIFGNGRYDVRWLGIDDLVADKNFWGVGNRADLATRIVDIDFRSALDSVQTHPMHLALVADAPAPLPPPAAHAPAPAAVAVAPAPAPVAPRVPNVTDPVPAKAGTLYFGETGHNVEGVFHTYFVTKGGIGRFGFPRTEAIVEDGLRVQWFERGRMEYHPQHAGTPYEVQLMLLGDTLTTALRPFPTAPVPCGTTPNCRYFPETQHIVHGVFLEYFENNGGLEAFGYPISELFRDFNDDGSGRAYTMQWFQRARLEHHPEVGQRIILLGLLGLEELDNRGLIR